MLFQCSLGANIKRTVGNLEGGDPVKTADEPLFNGLIQKPHAPQFEHFLLTTCLAQQE